MTRKYVASKDRIREKELENICKKAAVLYYKLLFGNFPRGIVEN